MDEQSLLPPRPAELGKGEDMRRLDRSCISLGLDQPTLASDDDLTIDTAIAGIAAVTDDGVSLPLEALEQQLFEGQGIHCA